MDDWLDSESPSCLPVKDRQKHVKKNLMKQEDLTTEESLFLKFYIDYEFPRNQIYLKDFWKRSLDYVMRQIFQSCCGRRFLYSSVLQVK